MSKIRIHIINFPDFKDRADNWVQCFSKLLNGVEYHYSTRAGKLWNAILKRSKQDGANIKYTNRYIDCKNQFGDFQEFAEWCQDQYGYMKKDETNRYWALDKDLKVFGNKNYGPDTCLFVPSRVNCLLTARNSKRGDFPLGVHFNKERNLFVAQCKTADTKTKGLGRYTDVMQAHKAWQRFKVEQIKTVALNSDLGECLRAVLYENAERIQEDLENNRETILL